VSERIAENVSDVAAYMREVGAAARTAAPQLARADSATKNAALVAAAAAIRSGKAAILAANRSDVQRARAEQFDAAFIDRLTLDDAAIEAMAAGLLAVAALPDPIGTVSEVQKRPSGIEVGRMRVPLGVVGMIYESRPNVTADAAALCLKAGNAVILRGGSEAIHSNRAIAEVLQGVMKRRGIPVAALSLIPFAER